MSNRKPKSRTSKRLATPPIRNRRLAVADKDGGFLLRITERKATGKKSPRMLIKCGCCDEEIEVYFGGGHLEIGGVFASAPEWRRVLGPLLRGRGQ